MTDAVILPKYYQGLKAKSIPAEWFVTDDLRQARICYLSFNCRTGGIDWPLLKQHYDAVCIRAGQGYWGYDELLHEHVDKANEHGIPYYTSWQADPGQDAARQGEFYADGYGVAGHPTSIAIEETGNGLISPQGGLTIFDAVAHSLGVRSWGYSRQNILFTDWQYPDWIDDELWEIARYPFRYTKEEQYSDLDEFFIERAWTYPRDLSHDFQPQVILWQFSEKIDARATFANARTADPKYSSGLYSGTASTTTQWDYQTFIELLGGSVIVPEPEPEPEPPAEAVLYKVRVKAELWNIRAHPANPAYKAPDMGDALWDLELCVFEEREHEGYTWLRCGGDNFWVRSDGMEIIS